MGKDLHYSILPFIKHAIESHSSVKYLEDISTQDEYIFKITRLGILSSVIVVLSDCYHFGEFDYLSKPKVLNNGGFILIAKPEATLPSDTQINKLADKIIIGKIGILLGALSKNEFWKYTKPKKENKNK